jgi:hypothetical protein
MYTGIGDVQEFRYPTLLMQAFLNSGSSISDLQNLDNLGWVPGSGANVFVVNHDLERTSGASLNYNSPSNTYTSAMVFSLAHPYGTPTILSSYAFSTYDQGAPSSGEQRILSSVLTQVVDQNHLRRGHLLWYQRYQRVSLSASLGCRLRHGRLPEHCRQRIARELGLSGVQPDRFWPRRGRLRRDQQRGLGVEHDVHHDPCGGDIL